MYNYSHKNSEAHLLGLHNWTEIYNQKLYTLKNWENYS